MIEITTNSSTRVKPIRCRPGCSFFMIIGSKLPRTILIWRIRQVYLNVDLPNIRIMLNASWVRSYRGRTAVSAVKTATIRDFNAKWVSKKILLGRANRLQLHHFLWRIHSCSTWDGMLRRLLFRNRWCMFRGTMSIRCWLETRQGFQSVALCFLRKKGPEIAFNGSLRDRH